MCLIDAIRSLGVPMDYLSDGPFWALADGNPLLDPFGPLGCVRHPCSPYRPRLQLRRIHEPDTTLCAGKYVLYQNNRFTSLEIWPDGECMFRPTCRRHIGLTLPWQADLLAVKGYTAVFALEAKGQNVSSSPDCLGGSEPLLRKSPEEWLQICHNRARLWKSTPTTTSTKRQLSEDDLEQRGLTRPQVERWVASYQQGKARKAFTAQWHVSMPPTLRQSYGVRGDPLHGIRIPLPPLDAQLSRIPAERAVGFEMPPFLWLADCHPHSRDQQVQFEAEGHVYYIKGLRAHFSVTSLTKSVWPCLSMYIEIYIYCVSRGRSLIRTQPCWQ